MSVRQPCLVLLAVLCLTASVQAGLLAPAGIHAQPTPAVVHRADGYVPIVPPTDTAGFITEAKSAVNFLANLPIESQIAQDVLEKILDALAVHLGDTITQLLKVFGIDFQVDLSHFSFKWLLNLLHFYSYAMDPAVKLLEEWTTNLPADREEPLKRMYLALTATKVSFESAMQMADDAGEGLYDLVDMVLAATRMVDRVGAGLGNVPVAAELIARVKVMITQRIVFAFQNAVQLATAPISEPTRSRIRAVATALATTYCKWKDIQLSEGFGGISVETVTKVGVTVMGKTVALMGPKVGLVALNQSHVTSAIERASAGEVTGTWDQARLKLLDDGDDTTENGFCERVAKTTARKSKLSRYEREAANVAGAISQIAQLVNIIDPSSITRVVAIVAGVVAGGLQIHSIFNSVHYLYTVPREMRTALNTAFHPDVAAGTDTTLESTFRPALPSRVAAHRLAIREAHLRFTGALEETAEASSAVEPELLVGALERLDGASMALSGKIARLDTYRRTMTTGAGEVNDPVYTSLVAHQVQMAAVLAQSLPLVLGSRDGRARRAFREALEELETVTRSAVDASQRVLEAGMLETSASLELDGPGALRFREMITVKATLSNSGSEPASGLEVRLVLPEGYRCNNNAVVCVEKLAPGQEKALSWTIVGSPDRVKRGNLAIFATSSEGLWASRFVHLSR